MNGIPPTEKQTDTQEQSSSHENRNTSSINPNNSLEPGSSAEEYNAMRRWEEETPQEGPWTDVGRLAENENLEG